MPKPISKVTTSNFYSVESYFQNLLERRGLFGKYSEQWGAEREAKQAFKDLPQPVYTQDNKVKEESRSIAIDALQSWIDQYAAHQWPKFLAVERQRKFKKKNHTRALELRDQAYVQLKWYAEKMNLSLNDAVEKLAKTALDKLRDKEWEQEQTKKVTR